jgi:hypothetical protein
MSLIQQALEKTGKAGGSGISMDTFLKKPTEKFPMKETSQLLKVKKTSGRRARYLWIFVIALFVLGQAGIVYYFLVRNGSSGPEGFFPEGTPFLPSLKNLPPSGESEVPKKPSVGVFVLSGISQVGGDRFAVINDQVFAMGEEVRPNIVVTDILPDQKTVILRDGAREIVLKL